MKIYSILLGTCFFCLASISSAVASTYEPVRFVREIRAELERPVDLASSDSGDTFVLDQKTLQINIYDAQGELRRQLGGKGSASGGLRRPVAIATGSDGGVVIADGKLNKVFIFDGQDRFIGAFGNPGKNPGEFGKLRDVAIDQFGFIYTADAGNKTVSRFSDRGILLARREFDGQRPEAIALDPAGNVYVVMAKSSQIYRFRLDGASSGRTRLKPRVPIHKAGGLFVDLRGDIYVSQSARNNIVKYDSNGTVLATFGSRGQGPGAFSSPGRLAGNSRGDLYVIDTKNARVQVFSVGGNYKSPLVVADYAPPTVSLLAIEPLEETVSDLLWQSSDLQLRLYEKSGRVVSSGLETSQQGEPGRKIGQFRSPQGLAVLSDGRRVIADTGNHRIQIVSAWSPIVVFGEKGEENGLFKSPTDVAVNSAGTVFVADSGNSRVQLFTDQGIYLRSYGRPGKSGRGRAATLDMLSKPIALAIDSTDNIYVLDSGSKRVVQFDGAGKALGITTGLVDPAAIAVDEADNLYVADNDCHCVKVMNRDGALVMQFGARGQGPGRLGEMTAITVGHNQVFVADSAPRQVKVFSLAMEGLVLEKRIEVSHRFLVPEAIVSDGEKMAPYRKMAMADATLELAERSGLSVQQVEQRMRTDKEVIGPGGEVHLTVSIARP